MVNFPAIAATQHTPHGLEKQLNNTAADFHYQLSVSINIQKERRKENIV